MLEIAADLALPDSTITQRLAIVARTGAGKTYTATVLVEEMLASGLPVVVLDPTGAWWGLRLNAAGDGPGFEIPVLGGDHGDIGLDAKGGAMIADLVVEDGLSLVLDLSDFSNNEQVRFATDFLEALYRRNRTPRFLVVDEADMFAPQRPMPDERRVLGAMEKIVRRGRIKGLGVGMITQRPAVLSKNVLTQVGMLIALQTTGPQDRAALDEWVKAHATVEQREALMGSLASLPIGTAWVWSPTADPAIFQRVQVRQRRTYDSGATPTLDTTRMPVAPLRLDLTALSARMAALADEAAADDPAALRRRIADLERQLRERPQPEVVFVPAVDDHFVNRMEMVWGEAAVVAAEVLERLREVRPPTPPERAAPEEPPPPPAPTPTTSPAPAHQRSPRRTTHHHDAPPSPSARATRTDVPESVLTEALRAIATFEGEALSPYQLGTLANIPEETVGEVVRLLKRRSLITPSGDGHVLTEKGRAELGDEEPLLAVRSTTRQLAWVPFLDGRERRALDELVHLHPARVSVPDLADRTGYPANGGFYGAVARLVRLGLVAKEGNLRGLGPMALDRSGSTEHTPEPTPLKAVR